MKSAVGGTPGLAGFFSRKLRNAFTSAAKDLVGFGADFTPVVGDIKGFKEAYDDPTAINIIAEGVGLVPVVGDAGGRILKNADTIEEVAEATGFLGPKRLQLKNAPYQTTRNVATEIGGRIYSGHALDQIQNRGITPTVVENTISTGAQRAGNTAAELRYYDSVNNVSVIVDRATGRVVTVRAGD